MSTTYSHLTQTYLEWQTSGTMYLQLQPGFIPVTTVATLTLATDLGIGAVQLSNVRSPIADTDAANKAYVDTLANGLAWKEPVIAATTGTHPLSGLVSVDGVTPSAGQRFLIKAQTNSVSNGIYLANAGAWTRALDMAVGSDASADAMFVQQGITYANKGFVCATSQAIVGTDALTFSIFATLNPGTAAGDDTWVQYNTGGSGGSGGSFAASGNFTWTNGTSTLDVNGTIDTTNLIATSATVGQFNATGSSTLAATTVTGPFVSSGLSTLSATTASGLAVSTTLNVGGDTVLSATTVVGDLRVTGTIAGGATSFTTLTVTNYFDSTGRSNLSSTTIAGLAVTGSETIGGSLNVTGASTFSTVTVNNSLTVTGFVTAASGSFGGEVVGQTGVFINGVTAGATSSFNNVVVTGNESIGGNLSVTGTSVLAATTVAGALNVTGVGSFTTNVTIAGDLTVSGGIIFNTSSPASFGTLTVTSFLNSLERSVLSATTVTSFYATLANISATTTGSLGVTDALTVAGTSNLSATTAGSLGVTGALTVAGTSTLGNTVLSATTTTGLAVIGRVDASGPVYGQEFYATSDIQYKTNIHSINNDPLQKLRNIECYSYEWKESFSKNKTTQYGVIAQQLEEIGLNELVVGTDSKAVNYQGLIPLLIASYQQQQKTIEQLQEDIEKLRTKKLIPK